MCKDVLIVLFCGKKPCKHLSQHPSSWGHVHELGLRKDSDVLGSLGHTEYDMRTSSSSKLVYKQQQN